ncbi:MAG: SH3 domain-containing protein [Amaricoccus sp.]|uniref:SH3 domain-containing protein n=1 Tax=Amaricoccus sp. TaxID=1872485 RepID=UPI0039E2F607
MRHFFIAIVAVAIAATGAFAGSGDAEFVEITGAAGALVLREGPTTGAAIVARLDDGTLLRTVSCQMAAGRKWCEVKLPEDAAVKGWVGMTNLRVVPAPTPTN